MMRQSKAMIAGGLVTIILVAAIFWFGYSRQPGPMHEEAGMHQNASQQEHMNEEAGMHQNASQQEHMNEEAGMHQNAPQPESEEVKATDSANDQEHSHSEHGHLNPGEDNEHEMNSAYQDQELTGSLNEGVRTVAVKARKFEFDPSRIVVIQGEQVRLEVTSEDVMHGIGIADFDIDKKLPAGETVIVEITPEKPGTHHFHCSVYCGEEHDKMHGEIVVLEKE